MDLSRLKITSAKNGWKAVFLTLSQEGGITAGPGDVDVVPATENVEGGHGHPKCCHHGTLAPCHGP